MADALQIGERGIDANGIGEDQSVSLAVLGDICEAVPDGVLLVFQFDFLAAQKQRPVGRVTIAVAEETHG